MDFEKKVLPLLIGGEGYKEEYSSAYEFKLNSNQDDFVEEKLENGWIFFRKWQGSHPILNLFKIVASRPDWGFCRPQSLIQFWGWEEEEGGHHYLSTRNQPFLVTRLGKGVSWYRNVCTHHVYDVDAEAEQLGSVGRAYRNKQPESTPDLRLYSVHEFPLRFQAARSGFRAYLALPLFDLHSSQNQCYGVLEFLAPELFVHILHPISKFYEILKLAGFRSTHSSYNQNQLEQQVDSKIKKTLELAIKAVPGLSLAQVWVPCKQCHTSPCMETAYLASKLLADTYQYRLACDLHTLQVDVNSNTILGDHTISKYPLAHFTHGAGLSLDFEIVLQSDSNYSYAIQFFLQPKYKQDSFKQVLGILKMKLQSFHLLWQGKLVEESILANPIEMESIDMLESMDSYQKVFPVPDFIEYLETRDLCCSPTDDLFGWVFHAPSEQVFPERLPMEMKMQHFMKELTFGLDYPCMVQFWAPIMVNERRCLTTRDQPYSLSCLAKGLASFRKECIKHLYPVDKEAKEDELGPVGRVFRNGHPELLYDLCSYSPQEFSMRTYALHCGIQIYLALPVFDDKHKCAGVIEFIGYEETYFILSDIISALEEAKLWPPNFYQISMIDEIEGCHIEAKAELDNVLYLIQNIPHCQTAKVWVPFEKCGSSSLRCMKWLNPIEEDERDLLDVIHVEPKIGMIGTVLESETKACFCQNVSEFGIAEASRNYYRRKLRCKGCFAICLQSSHTGDLLYVFEFFLHQSPTTLEYFMSFLKFLLPVLKHELKSFKIASGELVVEVIEFSEASQLTFPESEQIDEFPVKFKRVMYGQKEHEYIEEQQMQSNPKAGHTKDVVVSNFKNTNKGKRKWNKYVVEEEEVMIKVKWNKYVIKFKFHLSLGVVKLSEEVARRIKNLNVRSFELKYMDEDNDEILIACDEDLQLCPKVRASTGQTCIKLFIPE